MKRRDFLKATAAAAVTVPLFSARFVHAQEAEKKILYFDRSTSYVHPPTVIREDGTTVCGEALKQLGEKDGFAVDCTKDSAVFDGDLSCYGSFVFYTCGNLDASDDNSAGMSEQGIFNFYNAIRNGCGLVGIHSATDTWKTPGPDWENQSYSQRLGYTNLIGGQFIVHGDQQETTIRVVDKSLPYIGTLGDSFRCFDEWYTLKNFNPDLHVVLVQETEGMKIDGHNACYNRPAYPSTWLRSEGKGRVAYTSLGHNNERFWDDPMEGIMSDLLKFTLGRIDVDLTPNLETACPGYATIRNS